MTLSVVFRRQARREFYEAGDWYEKERTGLQLKGSALNYFKLLLLK